LFLTPLKSLKRLVFDAKQELEHVLTEQKKANIRRSCLMLKLHENIVNDLCITISFWMLMTLHEEVVAEEPQWRDHKFLVTIVKQPHDKIELPKVILKFFPISIHTCMALHGAFKTCYMVDLQACAFFDIIMYQLLLF
jgi:hypothetical protein